MLKIYTGTPGSGKSLHCAKDIVNLLKYKKTVIGNFDINYKSNTYHFIPNDKLIDPSVLIDFSQEFFKTHKFKEGSITLFLDEAQLLFNAREWSKAGRKEWLSFFTQHRKLGYNIILISQFTGMIDKQVQALIEYEVIHRKISNYGYKGKFLNLLACGGLFTAIEVWFPMKLKTGSSFFKYRKKYSNIYDTYNLFNA